MKRRPEELDELVAGALRRIGPITAYALASALRRQGDPTTEVQAYRVLKRLIARGEARQIWLGRRHAVRRRGEPPSMALVCRACERTAFAPAIEAHAALRACAAALGLESEEVVLEAAGLCGRCQSGRGLDRRRGEEA